MKTNEELCASRAVEKFRDSEYSVTCTDFLTPGEKIAVHKALTEVGGTSRCFYWGGCLGCERTLAVFVPEWCDISCLNDKGEKISAPAHRMPNDTERCEFFARFLSENSDSSDLMAEIPIRAIKIHGSGFKKLTHRDFMGAILSLGIERSVIGDIVLLPDEEESAVVFVHEKIENFILEELKKIGRDGVKTEKCAVSPDFVLPREFEELVVIVSSPRLDGIVKSITGKSRETAAEMIRNGLVELSYRQTDDVSAQVKEDDVISVRGFGKYTIGEVVGQTKSGRMKINLRKYV